LSGAAGATQNYSVQVLGTLSGDDRSVPTGINNAGQVVGVSSTSLESVYQSFLFDGSSLIDLLPGERTFAQSINDGGDVLVARNDDCRQSLLITADGERIELSTPECGGKLGEGLTSVWGLNSSRQVVGSTPGPAVAGRPPNYHAAVWTDGSVTDLGTLGGDLSLATAINDAGTVVGASRMSDPLLMHGFIFAAGQMKDLGTLGGKQVNPNAINSDGLVVGGALLPDYAGAHAFLYDGAQMIDLGSLPGFGSSEANGINSKGQIVGNVAKNTPTGSKFRGFLYEGGAMFDLNDLIVGLGWTIVDAVAINDQGQIAAVATGLEDDTLVTRAVLLTPY
jgi:probable HAF family extracellular repeat protein